MTSKSFPARNPRPYAFLLPMSAWPARWCRPVPAGRLVALAAYLVLLAPSRAHAYIGPGAGFAFAGSLFMMLAALGLALLTILLWPITTLWRLVRVGNPFKNASAKRVII